MGSVKQYCQLHGEFIGYQHRFVKKRNSTIRPWGSCVELYGEYVKVEPYKETGFHTSCGAGTQPWRERK